MTPEKQIEKARRGRARKLARQRRDCALGMTLGEPPMFPNPVTTPANANLSPATMTSHVAPIAAVTSIPPVLPGGTIAHNVLLAPHAVPTSASSSVHSHPNHSITTSSPAAGPSAFPIITSVSSSNTSASACNTELSSASDDGITGTPGWSERVFDKEGGMIIRGERYVPVDLSKARVMVQDGEHVLVLEGEGGYYVGRLLYPPK